METIKIKILSQNEYSDEVKKLAAKQQYFKAACIGDAVTQFSKAKKLTHLEIFGGSLEVLPSPYSTQCNTLNGSLSHTQEEPPSLA